MSFGKYPNQFNGKSMAASSKYSDMIPPFESEEFQNTRKYILQVNSRDRNSIKWPNTAEYKYVLKKPYYDILKVELISACVPQSDYTIHEYNNCLYIREFSGTNLLTEYDQDDTSILKVIIPVGKYTPTELASKIQEILNSSTYSLLYQYLVFYNTKTDTISIGAKYTLDANSYEGKFQLFFKGKNRAYNQGEDDSTYLPNSIGPVIGYNKKIYTSIVNT